MDTIGDYLILRETNGVALLWRPDGKRTVVSVDYKRGQVYDLMPGDAPRDGGSWCARMTTRGVDYVAGWYSRSYANRVYRSLTVAEDCDTDETWTAADKEQWQRDYEAWETANPLPDC